MLDSWKKTLPAFAGVQVHALVDFLVDFSFLIEQIHAGLGMVEGVILTVIFGDEESSLGIIRVKPGVSGFFVGVDSEVEGFHLFGEVMQG